MKNEGVEGTYHRIVCCCDSSLKVGEIWQSMNASGDVKERRTTKGKSKVMKIMIQEWGACGRGELEREKEPCSANAASQVAVP